MFESPKGGRLLIFLTKASGATIAGKSPALTAFDDGPAEGKAVAQ
jgi:hypothetical protein